MKIELINSDLWSLAHRFAGIIIAQVTSQHLALVAEPEKVGLYGRPGDRGDAFKDMRRAIRSIEPADERRSFIGSIRFIFRSERLALKIDVRGRDYAARVKAFMESERSLA
jgi:hypothetical protein